MRHFAVAGLAALSFLGIFQAPPEPPVYRPADTAEIFRKPAQFLDKALELRALQCQSLFGGGSRCRPAGSSAVTLLAAKVLPAAEEKKLQTDCDTERKAAAKTCRRTVRIIPEGVGEDKSGHGIGKIVLTAQTMNVLRKAP